MRIHNRFMLCTCIILLLSIQGCASKSHAPLASVTAIAMTPQWHDAHFYSSEQVIDIPSPDSIFGLNKAAKAFVNQQTRSHTSINQQLRALSYGILDHTQLNLLYAADANTDASTTFQQRAANCLSLTIMTYAMAEYAGFNSRFQQVVIPEYWTQRAGQTLINGHVNLRITASAYQQRQQLFNTAIVVDFDPQRNLRSLPTYTLSKQRVTAMFYNNVAADALLVYAHTKAYAFLQAALTVDPQFSDAWINLGLLYRREGHINDAQLAYKWAIELDSNSDHFPNKHNNTAWENLAHLYSSIGETDKASKIFVQLEEKRKHNPFYHYMLAQQAQSRQEYRQSIQHYHRAIALDKRHHQFYSGLAVVYAQQSDFDKSARYLRLAKQRAPYPDQVARYKAKLALLANM